MKRRKSGSHRTSGESCTVTPKSASVSGAPNITIRYRGSMIQLKGVKARANDFSKFVRRGTAFAPMICESDTEEENTYDFAPLLNIGVAELLIMLDRGDHFVSRDYLEWCRNLEIGRSWTVILDKAKEFLDDTGSDLSVLSTAVRSGLIDGRFHMVREIYRTLMALKVANPSSYVMALMEATRLLFELVIDYSSESLTDNLLQIHFEDDEAFYRGILARKMFKFGAVKYGGLFSHSLISDCRGLGINLFCLFMLKVYNKFASYENDNLPSVLGDHAVIERLRESFNSCIGTDAVGRYVKGKGFGSCSVEENVAMFSEQSGVPCLDGDIVDTMTLVPTDSGNTFVDYIWYNVAGKNRTQLPVGRDICEASILWSNAVGLELR